MSQRETISVNDIRTAIRELTTRAELAPQGRAEDAAELEQRVGEIPRDLGSARRTPIQQPCTPARLSCPACGTCCGGTRSAARRAR